jgi:hypothetical protein
LFPRPFSSFKVLFILLILTLSLGFSACSQSTFPDNSERTDDNPDGKIAAIPTTVLSITGGNVFIMKPGSNQWVKAEEGTNLEVDYKLKTEVSSQATVSFFDGSTIELEGETEITLSQLGFDEDSSRVNIHLRQELGQTISRIKKLADSESRYEVETPAAVAAVRGTIMLVKVNPDGSTVVGNIEGLVSVIAQGVEAKVTQGSHVVVIPGQVPGPVVPGITPTTTSIPTPSAEQSNTGSAGSGLASTPASQAAKIAIENIADRQTAYPGDTITYSYRVTNMGFEPLSDISLMNNKVEKIGFKSGDVNSNQYLDPGETWIFTGNYIIKAGESGQLTNSVTASGTGPNKDKAIASTEASVKVLDIIVQITSLQQGNLVTRTISFGGTVNDPSITQATITLNGQSSVVDVINGSFSTSVDLVDGTNTLTVTVTKPGGVMVSSSVMLVPE